MTTEQNPVYAGSTDLAVEANELAAKKYGDAVPGVNMSTDEDGSLKVTLMDISTEEAAHSVGKMQGHYVTIESPGLRRKDTQLQDKVATRFASEFSAFLTRIGIPKNASVLVIGLGNSSVTPDALGPLVVENIMITRHYFELMPGEVHSGYRQVSAVAPGVLGTTGIESSEIVQGIVDRIKPDLIIAIDALASLSLDRVNSTIQIADTGVHPGSGIGNKRKGLTKEILGVPCLAIGVPTVVYASTIVNNCIDMMAEHFKQMTSKSGDILGLVGTLDDKERLQLVREVLSPSGQDLLVTPKEVDQFIEDIANIIASGLNAGLHEAVDQTNVSAYTH
ncbi:GPR endopeptidase [Gorillibacterium massiliense]|uniref:GPR endopeptidase n=1 Tax=Gorillibacterium massiliense TaxID=1280390 RepID=UPI0004B126AE|nr:GPR endopeptidase [Gorillibacterium massiliense]